MKNPLFSLIFLCFLTSVAIGQEVFSNQSYSSPLSFNPAFTGYTGVSRIMSRYNSASPALSVSDVGYDISYDHYLNSLKGGLGIRLSDQYFRDNYYGRLSEEILYSTAGILLSKKIVEVNGFVLMLGSSIDYYERKLRETPLDLKKARGITVSSGLMFVANNFVGGFSVKQLNEPDISLDENEVLLSPRKYDAHVAYQFFNDKSKFRISPDVIYSSQRGRNDLLFGIHTKYNWARLGVRFKQVFNNSDHVIMYLGYQGKRWSINHSYSNITSQLSNSEGGYGYGTFDINATYLFIRKKDARLLNLPDIIAF